MLERGPGSDDGNEEEDAPACYEELTRRTARDKMVRMGGCEGCAERRNKTHMPTEPSRGLASVLEGATVLLPVGINAPPALPTVPVARPFSSLPLEDAADVAVPLAPPSPCFAELA